MVLTHHVFLLRDPNWASLGVGDIHAHIWRFSSIQFFFPRCSLRQMEQWGRNEFVVRFLEDAVGEDTLGGWTR